MQTLNPRLARKLAVLSLATIIASPALTPLALGQNPTPVFQASVSYKAAPAPAPSARVDESFVSGVVRDEDTGEPLSGVKVWVPDWQTSTITRDDGSFTIPGRPFQGNAKSVIASFQKPGYTPGTATLDSDRMHGAPFQLSLEKGDRRRVVLDDGLRHLGDGSYAPNSAGAAQFRAGSEGPVFRRQFNLHEGAAPKTVYIGSMIGLDTVMAQQAGQSHFHKTASPVTVVLNGRIIGYVGLNGDGHRLPIPPGVLVANGLNTLEIQTGYQFPDGQRIDYDDIELMLVTIEL